MENKPVVTSGERERGGAIYGWWSGRYKLLGERLQGCIIQHREYSQYFVIAVTGV